MYELNQYIMQNFQTGGNTKWLPKTEEQTSSTVLCNFKFIGSIIYYIGYSCLFTWTVYVNIDEKNISD